MKKLLYIMGIVLLAGLAMSAQPGKAVAAEQGFDVGYDTPLSLPPSQGVPQSIYAWGVCRNIDNIGGETYMIPANTGFEWGAFRKSGGDILNVGHVSLENIHEVDRLANNLTIIECVAEDGICGVDPNTCDSGVYVDLPDVVPGEELWQCLGFYGGIDSPICSALFPVDGICGALVNTCDEGNPFDLPDVPGEERWECQGINGGATDVCVVLAPVDGNCLADLNQCRDGDPIDVLDTATDYLWQCAGLNGGSTADCRLPKCNDPLWGWKTENWCSRGNFCDPANDDVVPAPLPACNAGTVVKFYFYNCEEHTIPADVFWIVCGSQPFEEQGWTWTETECSATINCPDTDGACGGEVNTCTGGQFSDVPDTVDEVRWQCLGYYAGTDATCIAPIVDGVCGAVANTCDAGILNSAPADGPGTYDWTCKGENGGNDAPPCSAPIPAIPACEWYCPDLQPLTPAALPDACDENAFCNDAAAMCTSLPAPCTSCDYGAEVNGSCATNEATQDTYRCTSFFFNDYLIDCASSINWRCSTPSMCTCLCR